MTITPSTKWRSSPDAAIIYIHQQTASSTEKGTLSADQDHMRTQEVSTPDMTDRTMVPRGTIQTNTLGEERTRPVSEHLAAIC